MKDRDSIKLQYDPAQDAETSLINPTRFDALLGLLDRTAQDEDEERCPFTARGLREAAAMIRILHGRLKQSKDAPLTALRDLHRPYSIYGECDHDHEGTEPGVVCIDEIGYTCKKEYEICRSCCCDSGGEQTEYCAMYHDHGPEKPICKTAEILGRAVQALGDIQK